MCLFTESRETHYLAASVRPRLAFTMLLFTDFMVCLFNGLGTSALDVGPKGFREILLRQVLDGTHEEV